MEGLDEWPAWALGGNDSRAVASAAVPWHYPSMRNRVRAAAAPTTIGPFQKGQVWRIGDLHLAVISVGKSLVHYRQYKTQPRGAQTTLCSKPDLQKYLRDTRAILLTG